MGTSHSSGPLDPEERILDATSASRLLRQAAEIDAIRTAGLTVAELRTAALEAGISREAFDAALARAVATPAASVTADAVGANRPASRWRKVETVTAGIGFGVFTAWISTWTTNDAIISIPFAIAALLSFQLAKGWRSDANLAAYLKEHVQLWAGIAAGIAVLGSEYWAVADRLVLTGIMGVAAGAIGVAIVTARFVIAPRARHMDDEPSDTLPPGRPRMDDRLRTIASWLGLRDDHENARAKALPLAIVLAISLAFAASTALA